MKTINHLGKIGGGARRRIESTARKHPPAGFSLLELLVSVLIIAIIMGAVFEFMTRAQKTYQGNEATSESDQSARAALEIMTQEIGQAGSNPSFVAAGYDPALTANKTVLASITASAQPQCVSLDGIAQINPGDWLSVDDGQNNEMVQILSTSNVAGGPCSGSNEVQAVFDLNHTASFPAIVHNLPYPSGILQGAGTSDDHTLEFFGDLGDNGVIEYVVYSLYAAPGATVVTINNVPYTLYTLYRSITPVTFAAGATNNAAYPLAQNVLYNTSLGQGPSGHPIFSFPSNYTVSIVPVTVTVVGTVSINLCIALNPASVGNESLKWYTMATQIRPVNLAAAVALVSAGAATNLPQQPPGLPMADPSNYYQ
ncbi:MAG: prepilin-type N-terminal cleavage/methylation domain-containing protein [Acidobacteriota bacterium]|nr:prepilin-type N-terminal cleavage/methylation domain-containing protein [Acidobacteriota bacterium]